MTIFLTSITKNVANRHQLNPDNMLAMAIRLSQLSNRAETLFIATTILANNPAPWLIEVILFDVSIKDGKPVPGSWLNMIENKALQFLYLAIALRNSGKDGLIQLEQKDNALSEIATAYVDGTTFDDFMEHVFPFLGNRCSILGHITSALFENSPDGFKKQFKGEVLSSKSDLIRQTFRNFLSQAKAKVTVNDIKVLTRSIANIIQEINRPVIFKGLNSVDDDAIEGLLDSNCKLCIKNSDVFNKNFNSSSPLRRVLLLTKCSETFINIHPATQDQLDENSCKILGKSRKTLVFMGPDPLKPVIANWLAGHRGAISLPDARILDHETQNSLSKHIGDVFAPALEGILSLTFADKLVESSGSAGLKMNHLRECTPELAMILSKARHGLSLNGIRKICDETARQFQFHCGILTLDGLTGLSEDGARYLLKRRGRIALYNLHKILLGHSWNHETIYRVVLAFRENVLDFDGLTHLDDYLCEALRHHRGGLRFPNLQTMDTKAVFSLAQAYSGQEFLLKLQGKEFKPLQEILADNPNVKRWRQPKPLPANSPF